MSVNTVVPLPGKDLTETMDSTAGRDSHIFLVAVAVLQDDDVWSTRWQYSGAPIVWE